MGNIFSEVSKYLMIVIMAVYTFECFSVFRRKLTAEKQDAIFLRQNVLMILFHLNGFLVLYDEKNEVRILFFYAAQLVFFIIVLTSFHLLYEGSSKLLINNLCMLLAIGFLMLTRLSFDKALKQFAIAVLGMGLTLIVPFLIRKIKFIRHLTWLYALAGILALAFVAVLGATSFGAKLSLSIAGISLQPSEFVKIIFVFFVAGMYYQSQNFKQVLITTAVAAVHVLILVLSKDLGGALIFFIVYLVMLYVATANPWYMLTGLFAGAGASVVAYHMFSHVRVRVIAWLDPVSVIKNEGYQIAQSLFAIGSGSWFGMGLYQGMPKKIPVVEQDFIFSAIAEEMGGIFAICLILVCISCFLMFLNIAMQLKEPFYKMVALGLGITYGFQVFLSIGGVIKFIPSTGVTLPLVSYGGSSLFSTMIIFAIIQGFYIIREREVEGQRNVKKDIRRKRRPEETTRSARQKGKSEFDTEIRHFR